MLYFLLLIVCASPGSGMPDTVDEKKYIIGGKDTNIAEVPYTAVLIENNHFICGATIVSEKYLLTAAHCYLRNANYSVRVGSSFSHKGGVLYKVKKMVTHPLYGKRKFDYDVAYLEVEDRIKFNTNVRPIAVTDAEPKADEVAKISGYGLMDSVTLSKQLQSAELPVLDRKVCRQKLPVPITPRMFCTMSKSLDICPYKGDSGGPIVVKGKVAGATSWGTRFKCRSPAVYVSFGNPDIRKFIKDNTGV